jgi:hypothetical protein
MKKKTEKIKYSNEIINAKVIKDFLPRPEDLVLKEDNVKVTLMSIPPNIKHLNYLL